ncbi:CpsD/CapB family tyrosine-protein kinase [Paenibacillus validus]|uniref:CpsD/CapB family tyrosine-protein kinase n=1 Tax=Paenibacillus validus TaxID=44253 RepID=UPI000FD9D2A1|nr:CpsD/CapB family tyrosine-protein kinase [Paenibacillus validus]MED4601672.1 CpsD/CapB family tyrosine-protein kinase [Paenibacillus validus]MED4606217.1 CpsD/CapB family tyrosine-protein kinase [Paenibacillus validus]
MPSSANASLITLINPSAQASEDFKSLRTKLNYSYKSENMKSFLITSIKSQEGKSVLAANLAISYAQAGKRVLLIDANLRAPMLHKFFHMENHMGLSDLLSGKKHPGNVPITTYVEGLSLLPAGAETGLHATELLASNYLKLALDQFSTEYDMIFVDSSAANKTADSFLLAVHCDGVVLAVKKRTVKQEEVVTFKQNLDAIKGNLVGFVFIDFEK